jgi:hypothetical protein
MKKSLKRMMIVIAAIMILISICWGCTPAEPAAPTTEPEVTHGEETQPKPTEPPATEPKDEAPLCYGGIEHAFVGTFVKPTCTSEAHWRWQRIHCV